MHLLLVVSNPRSHRHLEGLTKAAKNRGHEVTVFFSEESVKLLQRPSPIHGFASAFLACQTGMANSGMSENDLDRGARMSSLGELVELMEGCDRTLFLG